MICSDRTIVELTGSGDGMTGHEHRAAHIARSLATRLEHATALPASDISSLEVLIDEGDWELALETLCTRLRAYGVVPTSDERGHLDALGQELSVPVGALLGDHGADAGPPS
jgi:hypothetical protein